MRRLRETAERLTDRLDDDSDDCRPFPSTPLRVWLRDGLGHEDVAAHLGAGKFVAEAVSVTGPGPVLYTLAAMPAAGCVCLPRPLTAAAAPAMAPEQQNEQAWCLTVVTNAVVCWHTEYLTLAVDELRGAGRVVDAEVLAHISPAGSSVVNYYGSITVDYEHELAQLDEQGHRPLRLWQPTNPEPGCSSDRPGAAASA
ncbi:Tn3 family transposase [Streptomyces sp. SBC-4]|nr:Tn3 family transposase [Streptomyces sp. SBC-4]MDV5142889.1 Tn3 family transposase [Streptomyces sp. SBC-4]